MARYAPIMQYYVTIYAIAAAYLFVLPVPAALDLSHLIFRFFRAPFFFALSLSSLEGTHRGGGVVVAIVANVYTQIKYRSVDKWEIIGGILFEQRIAETIVSIALV